MKLRTDYDLWWCARCKAEWVTPSIPHNSACPICGDHGWWRKFLQGDPYEVPATLIADKRTSGQG